MQCGLCRLPFKKEYFDNDPIVNEIFQMNTQSSQERVRLNTQRNRRRHRTEIQRRKNNNNYNINNNIDNNSNNNNNHYNNINYYNRADQRNFMIYLRNINDFLNPNQASQQDRNNERIRKEEEEKKKNDIQRSRVNNYYADINNQILHMPPIPQNNNNINTNNNNDRSNGGGNVFCICIWFLLLGIISIGLGIICFGMNENIPFITIFGIFQMIIFITCSVLLILNEKIILFNVYSSFFFYVYFIILESIMFLFSFYISFIVSCCQSSNQRKKDKFGNKEIGVIIIILNIIIGGLGTLTFGISEIFDAKITKWIKIRDILFGIIQLIGFVLLLCAIFLLPFEKNNITKIIALFIFGGLSYCFSLYSGINICIKLNKK